MTKRRKKKSKARRYPKRRSRRNSAWFVDSSGQKYKGRLHDLRGNTEDRKRRRKFLLTKFGNGKTVDCVHCGKKLTEKTLTVDRIVPECQGGRYDRGNIQPSCKPCNDKRGSKLCPMQEALLEQREKQALEKFSAAKPADFGSAASNPKLRYKTVKRGRRGILRGHHKSFWRRSA